MLTQRKEGAEKLEGMAKSKGLHPRAHHRPV